MGLNDCSGNCTSFGFRLVPLFLLGSAQKALAEFDAAMLQILTLP